MANEDSLAMAACDAEHVPELVEKIAVLGRSATSVNGNDRSRLLEAARSLVRALETPRETIIRLGWAETTLYACIDTGIKIGLFGQLSNANTLRELATLTGTEESLLNRILKHLSAMGIVREIGPDRYEHTNLSRSLAHPKYADGFPCIANGVTPAIYKLPEYLARTGYRNPVNAIDGPFQYAFKTDKHWFAWANENEPVLTQFNNHMGCYHQGRPSWMDPDFYPVQERLIQGAKSGSDTVFLVDVGGSLGHDIEEFHRKHPSPPGRLVLQDLPSVIEQARQTLDPAIEPVPHDFFNEQPIQGARAYYLHSVLHDWPDADSRRILDQLTKAMAPGYSRLLINENVIPDVGANWQVTGQDLMMMTMVSSQERKEREWRLLLQSAGLMVVKIWRHPNGIESLIECE
ncbi:putative O-methyltransferase [Pleurostoma richardsiae]|uniref:O-methyltransferase n=1 Tax=Pleurostoma richardsiae TaxID=41990 RepID=A0AA38R7I0_9PEZI|nr:putative O-methyltransferase [Pleurostoma richardsiae]